MTEDRRDFPESRKIYNGNIKETQYEKMQIHCDGFEENKDDLNKIDPKLIGSLMYLVNTRIDSFYAVNVLSQSMIQLRQTH
jgi:hypothetical protein